MSQYSEDVKAAQELHQASGSTLEWRNLTTDEKTELVRRAAALSQDRREQEAKAVANRTKFDAVDAYRAKIAGTVPAHRLDTRQGGFLDGWDAAMAHIEAERAK